MVLTLQHFLVGVEGVYFGPSPLLKLPYRGVSLDSRKDCNGKVFFALKGKRFDGHVFAVEAWQKGSPLVVVERKCGAPCVVVPDTLGALQRWASSLLGTLAPKVVAVTGSSGKTTTKELIAHILRSRFRVHKTEMNYNNQVGLPYTVANMPEETQVLVLEMGTSSLGEIERLSLIARPHVGVLTNVGRAHLGPLGGVEGVRRAKGELLRGLRRDGLLVYNADDPLCNRISQGFPRTFTFGLEKGDVRGKDIQISQERGKWYTYFTAIGPWGRIQVGLPLLGVHHVLNALAALGVAYRMGVSPDEAVSVLPSFQGVQGRMSVRYWRGVLILDDSYNANPDSTFWALKTLASLPVHRRLALLGSMLELGEESAYWHRWIGERAKSLGIDWIGTLGDEAMGIAEGAGNACWFADHSEAAWSLANELREGDALLIKGSRGVQMERVLEALGVE